MLFIITAYDELVKKALSSGEHPMIIKKDVRKHLNVDPTALSRSQ